MSDKSAKSSSSRWTGILRGKKRRPLEWLAEKGIFLVSLSAILMVFLIFLFVGREALPIFLGKIDSSVEFKAIEADQMDSLSDAELQTYLELTDEEFAEMDAETRMLMMEVKVEEAAEAPKDKDSAVNTTEWKYLLKAYQWTGYDKPERIWQPVSEIHKYNIIPLLIGSLKATLVALLFAVPLSLAAAIYVSQLARPRVKEWLKPAIEMLAGIPSVVLGFFALLVMATVFQNAFWRTLVLAVIIGLPMLSFGGFIFYRTVRFVLDAKADPELDRFAESLKLICLTGVFLIVGWFFFNMVRTPEASSRLNTFVAGIALGLAIVPVIFSIAEDALTSVPNSYTQAALALGSSKWQAAWRIVLPAALPGVFAAVVLGFGRAIGETMIVLMASGNASIVSWDIFESARTITATIAAELAETVFGGHHYRMLFMLGTILFAVTFVSNLAGDLIIHRLKKKLEGNA